MITTISQHYQRFFQLLVHPEWNSKGSHTTLHEAIILTWPFVLLGKLTQLALTLLIFSKLREANHFYFFVQDAVFKFGFLFVFFYSLWSIIFYPLKQWLFSYVWVFTLQFYQRVSRRYHDDQSLGNDLTAASLTGDLFLIVPIFGSIVKSIVKFYTLYRGIKIRLNISKFASFCILASPLLFGIVFFLFSLFCFLLFCFFLFN